MSKKLYVGNLTYSASDESLNTLFEPHGTVTSCRVITDRATGRSKGFGFVEMSNEDEASQAISELDGKDFEGRPLTVNVARERQSGGGGGGGGGYGGSGGSGGSRDRGGYGGGRPSRY